MGELLKDYVSDYVIFDLETTGLSTETDRVVEIAGVKVRDGKVVQEFETLVNPGMPIPYMASEVNGITDDMVADAPAIDKALQDFLDFVGDMVLVGHNIDSFDLKFILRDAQEHLGKGLQNAYIDTLLLSRVFLPQLAHHSLSNLAEYYGIDTSGAHRALADCRMTQKVFECLAKEMENPSEEARQVKRCRRCGSVMKRRSGKFGEFWGCSRYPACKYTEN